MVRHSGLVRRSLLACSLVVLTAVLAILVVELLSAEDSIRPTTKDTPAFQDVNGQDVNGQDVGVLTSGFMADEYGDVDIIHPVIDRTDSGAGKIQLEDRYRVDAKSLDAVGNRDISRIVARVNGHPVTVGRLNDRRAKVLDHLAEMRDVVSRIVPDEQVRGNVDLIPESWGWREFYGRRISLIESHGIDTVALGGLILPLAALSKAVEAGHSADPAEVRAFVEEDRTNYLYGQSPDLERYVSTYGFDSFFDVVLTERISERLTIDSWAAEITANSKSSEERWNTIRRSERNLVDTAEVVIVDAVAVGTTVQKAIAYAKAAIALNPPRHEPVCANGVAVADPIDNRPLVDDCGVLLDAKDTLRSTAPLDWSPSKVVTDWKGITTGGTPSRVTKIELPGESLSGTIPAEIGVISELTHLDLSANSLTGDIPEELRRLYNLQSLKLSGNSLTGCLPLHWRDVATNDLSSLNLLYCAPPPPGKFRIVDTEETSVTSSWDAVPGASNYRIEYENNFFEGSVLDDDTLTGTSHTVDGLDCGDRYDLWVSAQGDGTGYANGWSQREPHYATTTECVSPVFDEKAYTFVVGPQAAPGTAVGSVSANDPNGDSLSYSILGGNEAGKFAIDGSTGRITVSESPGAPETYTLTVQASDGANTGTVTAEIAPDAAWRSGSH